MPRKLLLVNGSAHTNGANFQLMKALSNRYNNRVETKIFNDLSLFPLFTPGAVGNIFIQNWKKEIQNADTIIISTPAYLDNIPAVLKNALEWITESGELHEKKVIPITFTPHAPRGEFVMQSLLKSLKSLNALVVMELCLHQNEQEFLNGNLVLTQETQEIFNEMISWI
jgi:chromate reductase, NAD(P)H dehydrogenase (quinone)